MLKDLLFRMWRRADEEVGTWLNNEGSRHAPASYFRRK